MRILGALLLAAACAAAVPAAAQQTPLPNNPHGQLKAGMDCADCHTSSGWKPMRPDAKFDHGRDTGYGLNGAHVTVSCTRCHLDLKFSEPKAKPSECTSCHVDVHRGAMPGECIQCHTERDFHDVPVAAIHQRTGFPLAGAHLNTPCESCHKTEAGGAFSAVPRDCVSCHRADLDRAAASGVDHSGFSRDCTTCHTSLAWSGGANFDHVTVSGGFGLEGAHALQRCEACHVVPGFTVKFSPAPTGTQDCIACHRTDYQTEHGTGWPTTCTECHNVNSWASSFNHTTVSGGFTLEGAHTRATCESCHVIPGYASRFTPAPTGNQDCIACHQADYQAQHAADQYPTTCTTCHSTSNWNSTFNHDPEFPINSGAHRGQWANCATCHTTPGNLKAFTCFNCHTHSQSNADAQHRGRSGYSYTSTACYSCHPRGRAG